MDTTVLVSEAQRLVTLLDEEGYPPRGAMLFYNSEVDSWRLWIVPSKNLTDQKQFFGRIASLIVDHQSQFTLLDASDVDLRLDDHPAIKGLSGFIQIDGLQAAHLSGNTFNGFYIPDGIVLRMAL